jgi:hypothetical protein
LPGFQPWGKTYPVVNQTISLTIVRSPVALACFVIMTEMLSLQRFLPEFSAELYRLLVKSGRTDLAAQVSELSIHERCRCGDSFCGTFYTAPKPEGSYSPGHENVVLEPDVGMVVLDVVGGEIKCVEVLGRNDVRAQVHDLVP